MKRHVKIIVLFCNEHLVYSNSAYTKSYSSVDMKLQVCVLCNNMDETKQQNTLTAHILCFIKSCLNAYIYS